MFLFTLPFPFLTQGTNFLTRRTTVLGYTHPSPLDPTLTHRDRSHETHALVHVTLVLPHSTTELVSNDVVDNITLMS